MRFLAKLAAVAAMILSGPAYAGINVLWYTGGVESTTGTSYQTNMSQLSTPGAGDPSSSTWSITYWAGGAMPAGAFNALVVASPQGGWSAYPDYTALDTAGLTFGDRVLVTGQDADWHYINSPGSTNFDGPRGFLRDSINWAGAGTGLGLVVLGGTQSVLDAYGFSATLGPSSGSTNVVNIPGAFAAFPINTNLTSAGLSNWSTSAHDIWSSPDTTVWTGINTTDGGGYVTLVSAATAGGGISGGGVPEPSTWALMIMGFGLAGLGLRRRRAALAV
jgi:hypothetical protein